MTKIIDVTVKRVVECSREVAWWNYWDHEHLDVVHKGYKSSDILYEKKNVIFREDYIQLPIFSFIKVKTPVFMVQENENKLYVYAIQFGITSKTTIKINEINEEKCEIEMNYKFLLKGIQKILGPILKKMIYKWNYQVWIEDLPLKIRRQKIVKLNFKDFKGLPDDIEERSYNGKIKFSLPIPRLKNSKRDQNPLNNRFDL